MKAYEYPLLNTYYHAPPHTRLEATATPRFTVSPDFITALLQQAGSHPVQITPDHRFLYSISREDTPVPSTSYVALDDAHMITSLAQGACMHEWIHAYWDKPLLVSNPFFEREGVVEIFSLRHGMVVGVDDPENLFDFVIRKSCFTIANGLTIALSLVAKGYWKEEDFLIQLAMLNVPELYHPVPDHWNHALMRHPHHLMDNPFLYAFIFCSKRVYESIYPYTYPVAVYYHPIYGSSSFYLTSLYHFAKTKHQFQFLTSRTGTFEDFPPTHYNMCLRLQNLLAYSSTTRSLPSNLYMPELTQRGMVSLIQEISRAYPTASKKAQKRLALVWRTAIRSSPKEWERACYLYLHKAVSSPQPQPELPPCPIRLVKDTIYRCPSFDYTRVRTAPTRGSTPMSWRDILFRSKERLGLPYHRLIEKKVVKRLVYLKKVAIGCIGEYNTDTLMGIMRNYYTSPEHRNELWR